MKMYRDKYIVVIVIGYSFSSDTSLQKLFCFRLEKSILENMGDLNGKGCILTF